MAAMTIFSDYTFLIFDILPGDGQLIVDEKEYLVLKKMRSMGFLPFKIIYNKLR